MHVTVLGPIGFCKGGMCLARASWKVPRRAEDLAAEELCFQELVASPRLLNSGLGAVVDGKARSYALSSAFGLEVTLKGACPKRRTRRSLGLGGSDGGR